MAVLVAAWTELGGSLENEESQQRAAIRILVAPMMLEGDVSCLALRQVVPVLAEYHSDTSQFTKQRHHTDWQQMNMILCRKFISTGQFKQHLK